MTDMEQYYGKRIYKVSEKVMDSVDRSNAEDTKMYVNLSDVVHYVDFLEKTIHELSLRINSIQYIVNEAEAVIAPLKK